MAGSRSTLKNGYFPAGFASKTSANGILLCLIRRTNSSEEQQEAAAPDMLRNLLPGPQERFDQRGLAEGDVGVLPEFVLDAAGEFSPERIVQGRVLAVDDHFDVAFEELSGHPGGLAVFEPDDPGFAQPGKSE